MCSYAGLLVASHSYIGVAASLCSSVIPTLLCVPHLLSCDCGRLLHLASCRQLAARSGIGMACATPCPQPWVCCPYMPPGYVLPVAPSQSISANTALLSALQKCPDV